MPSARRLDGQVALITGGGRGIGQAIACAFGAEGASVVVAEIDAEAASATAAAIGANAVAVATDVTSPEAQDRLFGRVRAQFDRLDILVNNAGIFHVAPLLEFPLEDWRRVFAVNLDGALLATQRAGRMMQAQAPHPVTNCRGKILNISSGAAERAAGSPVERLQKPDEVAVIAVWVAARVGMSLNGQLVHTEAHVGALP